MENLKTEILAVVTDELGTAFDPAKIVLPDPVLTVEEDGQKRVRVEVGYTFETAVNWPILPSSVDIRRAVEMRVIR